MFGITERTEASRRKARRVLGARRGASSAEFALVSIPFFVFILGIMEVAWQLATATALDHAVLHASRFGITGLATRPGAPQEVTCRSQAIPWVVTRVTNGFLKPSYLTLTTTAYGGVSGMGGAGTSGAGEGGQVVSYSISYRQPFITGGFAGLVGGADYMEHRAALVVKNEPFENAVC